MTTARHDSATKLSPQHTAHVKRLVSVRGYQATAESLRVGVTILEKIVRGGLVTPSAAARIAAAIVDNPCDHGKRYDFDRGVWVACACAGKR